MRTVKNLKEKKYREFFKELFLNTIFVSFFLLMLFGRAFTGIIVFGFRLGELAIGLGLFIFHRLAFLLHTLIKVAPIFGQLPLFTLGIFYLEIMTPTFCLSL